MRASDEAEELRRTKPRRPSAIELYAERPIRTQRDLRDYIGALDEDEGVRIEGHSKEHANGGFVFVGTYRGSYCVNLCDKVWNSKLRKYLPGGNDEFLYFETANEAFDYVKKLARRPLRAWLY